MLWCLHLMELCHTGDCSSYVPEMGEKDAERKQWVYIWRLIHALGQACIFIQERLRAWEQLLVINHLAAGLKCKNRGVLAPVPTFSPNRMPPHNNSNSNNNNNTSVAILSQVATVAQTIRCDSQFTRVEGVWEPWGQRCSSCVVPEDLVNTGTAGYVSLGSAGAATFLLGGENDFHARDA